MRTLPSGKTTLTGSILEGESPRHRIISPKPSDSRIGYFAVFGEHGGNYIDHDVKFSLISRGDIDEDVPRVQRYFAVLRIDNGRH